MFHSLCLLAAKLQKPLLLEGPAGSGKTTFAPGTEAPELSFPLYEPDQSASKA